MISAKPYDEMAVCASVNATTYESPPYTFRLRAATPTCDTTTDTGRVGAGAEDAGSDCGRSEDDDDSDSFHGEVDVTDTSSEDGLSGVTRAAGVACASASATSVGAAALPTDSGTGGHRSGSESAEQSSEQREARTPVPDTSDAGSEPSAPNARRRSRQVSGHISQPS